MIEAELSFFSSMIQCLRRTKEQREFEQELYMKGLEKEQAIMIQKINNTIVSKEFALKFILQELDVARQGDTFLQYFAKKSGFHIAEYSGALEKFQQEKEEIEKIQSFFLVFLNKISNEKIMVQTAISILNGVMEYWEIGKYSEEGEAFFEEEPLIEETKNVSSWKLYFKALASVWMKKLVYLDDKIQEFLDAFILYKESKKMKKEASKVVLHIYTEEKVSELMEEYSHVIEEIITGNMKPENSLEVQSFQEQISLATLDGNNLASVFCAFFKLEEVFPTLPLPINNMDNKSKSFFIEILNTFEKKGFSEHLHKYLEKNGEDVYALAKANDMFMQYLIAFWYVRGNEDSAKVEEEQYFWYNQSALNGFKPAIQRIENSKYSDVDER